MRLGDVRVEAPRALEELMGPLEVPPLELHDAQVRERFDEARVVFERQVEARAGGLEIALREGLCAQAVEGDGFGRQGRGRVAATAKQAKDAKRQPQYEPEDVSGGSRHTGRSSDWLRELRDFAPIVPNQLP